MGVLSSIADLKRRFRMGEPVEVAIGENWDAEPAVVPADIEWDFAIWHVPLERISPDSLRGTVPPTMRIYRMQCEVVGDELHVQQPCPREVYTVPIEECTFYKESVI